MALSRIAALDQALRAAGIPIIGVSSGTPPTVQYDPSATPAQITQGNTIAASFDMNPRRSRKLYDIWQDIGALNATQQTNIWNDFTSGSPPKWSQHTGSNAAAIMA